MPSITVTSYTGFILDSCQDFSKTRLYSSIDILFRTCMSAGLRSTLLSPQSLSHLHFHHLYHFCQGHFCNVTNISFIKCFFSSLTCKKKRICMATKIIPRNHFLALEDQQCITLWASESDRLQKTVVLKVDLFKIFS